MIDDEVTRPVAVITGASRGIGAEIARLFAAHGYDLGLLWRSDQAAADKVQAECEALGATVLSLRADVSHHEDVARAFLNLERAFGKVNCLINNAWLIGSAGRLADLTPSELAATFQTNVFGMVWMMQEATRRMSSRRGGEGGVIVNLSSLAATLGSPGEYVHYAASKAAVETLSIGAAKELASERIRVCCIRVGTTRTDIHSGNGGEARLNRVASLTPLGRVAEPLDIAEAALWLASDKAAFVSGTVLTVAGGLAP